MKSLLVLPISLYLLLPLTTRASRNDQVKSVCVSFAAGEIDALKTLDALDLNIYDYSIGLDNTAKIFCA